MISFSLKLVLFQNGVSVQLDRLRANSTPSADYQLNYPLTNVEGFKIHMERIFFGVKLKWNASKELEDWGNLTGYERNEDLALLTNMQSAKVSSFTKY